MRLDRAVLGAACLLGIFGGPWLVRQMQSLPEAHHLAARADQRIVTIEVTGMRDAACERDIAAGLAAVAGVTASEVRVGMARAYVVVTREVADSALVSAIERSGRGYTARIVGK